jgi:hypothetical protein
MLELCKAVKVLVLDGNIATKEKCKNEQRETKEKKIEKKNTSFRNVLFAFWQFIFTLQQFLNNTFSHSASWMRYSIFL